MNSLDQKTINNVFGAAGLGKIGCDSEITPIREIFQIPTFSQENLEWIGKADIAETVMNPKAITFRHRANDHVFIGSSPYRILLATDERTIRFRSYWWEVKCTDQYYSEGSLQFKGLQIEAPLFRSAVLQRDILIKIFAIGLDNQLKKVDEIMLFDSEIRKGNELRFQSGKGQIVSDRLMVDYDHRMPVTCYQLYEWKNHGIFPAANELPGKGTAVSTENRSVSSSIPKTATAIKQKKDTVCTSCGKSLQKEWKICPFCSTPVNRSCPQCHKSVEMGWVSCPYCGNPL